MGPHRPASPRAPASSRHPGRSEDLPGEKGPVSSHRDFRSAMTARDVGRRVEDARWSPLRVARPPVPAVRREVSMRRKVRVGRRSHVRRCPRCPRARPCPRLLRPFPSASPLRPSLRPFFSYSEGRRGEVDGKRRSGGRRGEADDHRRRPPRREHTPQLSRPRPALTQPQRIRSRAPPAPAGISHRSGPADRRARRERLSEPFSPGGPLDWRGSARWCGKDWAGWGWCARGPVRDSVF